MSTVVSSSTCAAAIYNRPCNGSVADELEAEELSASEDGVGRDWLFSSRPLGAELCYLTLLKECCKYRDTVSNSCIIPKNHIV